MEVETEVNDPNEDSLTGIQFVLMDLLDEFDVERFEPERGADYRTVEGIADNPKELDAPSSSSQFTIVDVLKPGYRLRSPDGPVVIVPARVSVYGAFPQAQPSVAVQPSDSAGTEGAEEGMRGGTPAVEETDMQDNLVHQNTPLVEEKENG